MRLLIRARNCSVGIASGTIVPDAGDFDVVVEAPDAELRPGLINAHDHLHRNHYGRLGHPPYPNAPAWAADIQVRDRDAIAHGKARPRDWALREGAWKNLFAGVTTVVHHDAWESDFEDGFPLAVVRVQQRDSIGMGASLEGIDPGSPYALHVAEGTDERSAEDVPALHRAGYLTPKLLGVHGVGMDANGIALFRSAGAAVIWCPTSNLFLFGRTAPASLLAPGTDVLLGTDSLLTADGDLLDELRCARSLGLIDDHRLVDAVGTTAARVLGLPQPSLDCGKRADLVLLSRPLLEASAKDVLLVAAQGRLRVLRPDLVPVFGAHLPAGTLRRRGPVERWTSTD